MMCVMRISIRYKQTKGWRNLDLKKAVLSTYIKTFGFSIHILVWPLMLTTNENGLRWLFPNLYIFNLTSYFLRLSVSFFFLRDAICESFSVSLFIVNTTLSISFFLLFFLSFFSWLTVICSTSFRNSHTSTIIFLQKLTIKIAFKKGLWYS